MILWVTVKRVNEKRLKKLNAILKHHMTRPHSLPHEVSAFIYFDISFYIYFSLKIHPRGKGD